MLPLGVRDPAIVLEAESLTRSYPTPGGLLPILRGVDLAVRAGEAWAIQGPSGSGKSTLLHLLAGLDRPTAGRVRWGDLDVAALPERRVARERLLRVGLVFQRHHLLEELSAVENVSLPGRIGGRVDVARAQALLALVGLAGRADFVPARLSGGERQRVAVARALYAHPSVVLADEPTGNLDRDAAAAVGDALLAAARAEGAAVVIVTHDDRLAARVDRRAVLAAGRLQPIPAGGSSDGGG
jgi:lipoprotein-releasing system ATP-binding protein